MAGVKKAAEQVLFTCILAGAGYLGSAILAEKITEHQTKQYVTEHIKTFQADQCKQMNLCYTTNPDIIFSIPPGLDLQTALTIGGGYDNGTLYFPLWNARPPPTTFATKLQQFHNEHTPFYRLFFSKRNDVAPRMHHELAHLFTDERRKQLGVVRLIDRDLRGKITQEQFGQLVCERIIAEGIATYVQAEMNDHQEAYTRAPQQWPKWPQEWRSFLETEIIYNGGYQIVKPILNEHGKRGIDTLILFPLQPEELSNPLLYQKRIMDLLKY